VRDAFNDKDIDAFLALMQPNIEFEHVAAPSPFRGHEAVRAFYAGGVWRAFSDMRLELVDGPFLHPTEPHGMVAWTFSGMRTGRLDPPGLDATEREVSALLHERFHVRDGKLAKVVVVFDVAEMLRQVGVLPGSGTAMEAILMSTQNLRTRVARLVRHE
jgi:hypothetical protein